MYEGFPTDRDAPLWVVVDSLEVPLWVDGFERRGRTSAVVTFADIDTPRRALEVVGKELLFDVPTTTQESDDQVYMEDLVGYAAHLSAGIKAVVEDFIDNDLNPLFLFTLDGREVLVPAVEDLIEKIDERRREVWFSLPHGLLDLGS
jgi:16S rRNA processing protein RimM